HWFEGYVQHEKGADICVLHFPARFLPRGINGREFFYCHCVQRIRLSNRGHISSATTAVPKIASRSSFCDHGAAPVIITRLRYTAAGASLRFCFPRSRLA